MAHNKVSPFKVDLSTHRDHWTPRDGEDRFLLVRKKQNEFMQADKIEMQPTRFCLL